MPKASVWNPDYSKILSRTHFKLKRFFWALQLRSSGFGKGSVSSPAGTSVESGSGNSHLSVHACCTQPENARVRGRIPIRGSRRGAACGWVEAFNVSPRPRGALINVAHHFVENANTPLTFAPRFYFRGLNVFLLPMGGDD